MTFYLGLTGGIATGKSSVTAIFKEKDIPVIDSDQLMRVLQQPEMPLTRAIQELFGKEYVQSDGSLNRERLGQLIFSNKKKKEELDRLIDPFIRQKIVEEMEKFKGKAPLVVVDVPLLFERNYTQYFDEIMCVYVPKNLQIKRLMTRNQLSEKQATQRVESQLSIERKKKWADCVIDNTDTLTQTKTQIEKWLRKQDFLQNASDRRSE